MRHQLLLVISFILCPKVLLLDEPLVSLDPIIINDTKKNLVTYAKQGNIVIISTHIISIAQQISDEILILSNGKLIMFKNCLDSQNFEKYVIENI